MKKNILSKLILIFSLLAIPTVAIAYNYFWSTLKLEQIHKTEAEPLDIVTGDITGDQYPDVITANRDGRSLSIFFGNGDGTLTAVEPYKFNKGATSLALADMNADGQNDLIVTLCGPNCENNSIVILQGQGNGQFTEALEIAVEGVPYNIIATDFNTDGKIDLAASDFPNDRILVWFQTEELWKFEVQNFSVGQRPIAVATGDLNNDGFSDLISLDQLSATMTIYLSNGKDGFSYPQITIPTSELPYAIALGNLTQDNVLDLVVAHSSQPGLIDVFHGRGDGYFDRFDSIEFPDRLIFAGLGDLNLDGQLDVITTNQQKKFALALLNDQQGSFKRNYSRVSAEDNVYSLAFNYLNQDQYLDLVTVDFEQATASVSLGHKITTEESSAEN